MTASEIHTPITAEELAHTFEEQTPEVDLKVYAIEDWATFAIFWLMTLAVFLQFFTRYVLNNSFAWTEEIATYCLVAIVFVGAAMCVRLGRHIHVDFLFRYLPAARRPGPGDRDRRRSGRCSSPTRPGSSGTTWSLIEGETMTTIDLPKNLVYGAVCVGFILMFVRSIQVSVENWRRGYSILERPEAFDAAPI